jgi:hypothetical protein
MPMTTDAMSRLQPGDMVYHTPRRHWCEVFDLTAGAGRVRLLDAEAGDALFIADAADCRLTGRAGEREAD